MLPAAFSCCRSAGFLRQLALYSKTLSSSSSSPGHVEEVSEEEEDEGAAAEHAEPLPSLSRLLLQ